MLEALLYLSRQIAAAHDRWRSRAAPRRPMLVELSVPRERLERVRAENDLLRARLRRLHPRRRPRYRPWERLAVLWHRARYGLSLEATARAFVVSVNTVLNWSRDVAAGKTDLVQAKPPVNRLPDLVADLVHRLRREWPRWGTRRIAGILARLGFEASRTTVQRMLRRPPRRPAVAIRAAHERRGPLLAQRPGHIYMIDFTRLGGFVRSVFVGAVIDAYSRKVLAIRVCDHEPSAAFAVRLLREAVRDFGSPVWVVTDQGRQFTSAPFRRAVRRCGARRRLGAVGRKGSIALIERFWRSAKQEHARGISLYAPLRSIEARLRAYAVWHGAHRPHQGLRQRTPDEVHFQRSTRPTRVPLRAVLAVQFLDGDRTLPVLRLRLAA